MFLGLIALNIIHPGLILQGPDSSFPKQSRAEKKELKAQKEVFKMEKKRQKRNPEREEFISEAPRQEPQDETMRFY